MNTKGTERLERFARICAILLVAGLVFLVTSGSDCPGEPGPAGPEGEQGERGLMGRDGEDGEDGQDGQDGTTGPIYWQGVYSSSTSYIAGDAVSYQGSAYICIQPATGRLPTYTTYWDVLAQKGAGEGGIVEPFTFTEQVTFEAGTNGVTWEDNHIVAGNNVIAEYSAGSGGIYNIRCSPSPTFDSVDINGGKLEANNQWDHEIFELKATGSGSGVLELKAYTADGSGAIRIRADDEPAILLYNENGELCVRIEAGPSGGDIDLYDTKGNNTISFDAETGNIFYSGELVKK